MIRNRFAFIALLAVLFVAGCQPAGSPPADMARNCQLTQTDLADIDAGTRAWAEGALANDWDAIGMLYQADAVVMPPNAPTVQGTEAIVAFFRGMGRITAFELDNIVVDGRDDMAYVRGDYMMTMETPDGLVTDEGKYLEIRTKVRETNHWLISIDMFSSDLPLPD
jgi:ketosteroid isomerase-like protein